MMVLKGHPCPAPDSEIAPSKIYIIFAIKQNAGYQTYFDFLLCWLPAFHDICIHFLFINRITYDSYIHH